MSDIRPFVSPSSIVRRIWGNGDTVLFIFAGSAAEFALNKAVDWLFYTGKLPSDPIGRLFSTVAYAHRIIFSPSEEAHKAIDTITAIHGAVEQSRDARIPAWAYRDVLYMLIHYSISSYELLERRLTDVEKEEVYDVFCRLGKRMNLEDLPDSYSLWLKAREEHLLRDLARSKYSDQLFQEYKKHLGAMRFALMLRVQWLVAPPHVREELGLRRGLYVMPLLAIYKLGRAIGIHRSLRDLLLPPTYKEQVNGLDR